MSLALPAYDRWMASAIESGLACAECGAEFTKTHDQKTLCGTCGRMFALEETKIIRLTRPEVERVCLTAGYRLAADEDEKNKRAIITVARAKKAAKRRRLEQQGGGAGDAGRGVSAASALSGEPTAPTDPSTNGEE